MTAPIPADVIEQLRTRAATEAEAIVREAVASMVREAPDLRDLEQRIRERVLALGGSLLEQALALAGPGYDGANRRCPCGGRQKFVGYRSKQIVTLLAPLTLRRAYYHCRQCHQGTIPLDRRWDVVGTGFSPALREAVAWLTAELPFGRSAELLGRLCRVTISKQWVEQFTHTLGHELEAFPEPLPAVDPLATDSAEPRRGLAKAQSASMRRSLARPRSLVRGRTVRIAPSSSATVCYRLRVLTRPLVSSRVPSKHIAPAA